MSFDFIAFTNESTLDNKTDKQAHFSFEHYQHLRANLRELANNPIAPYSKQKAIEGNESAFLEKIKSLGPRCRQPPNSNVDFIVKIDNKKYHKVAMINTESQNDEERRFMGLIDHPQELKSFPEGYPIQEIFEIRFNGSLSNEIFKPRSYPEVVEEEKSSENQSESVSGVENRKIKNPKFEEMERSEWLRKIYMERKTKNSKKQKGFRRNQLADQSTQYKKGKFFKIKYLPEDYAAKSETLESFETY